MHVYMYAYNFIHIYKSQKVNTGVVFVNITVVEKHGHFLNSLSDL